MVKISKLSMLPLILLTVCAISQPVQAEKNVYVFGPDQSTVVKTGGFVGLLETYAVTGQFQLTVDSNSSVASFEIVDANLTDETGSEYGRSLDEIFNMTGLSGSVIDETTIEFEGKTADGTESDVRLKLSFSDDSARITGQTTPPPNSADMFFYDVNAVATRKYAGGTGEPNNPYHIATAEDLMLLGESPEDYDKHFILTADIDLDPNLPGGKVFDRAIIAPDVNQMPWGIEGTPFTGVFDGNGYTISYLTVNGPGCLGLFGWLWGEVKDLGVVHVNISGSENCVAGLVGASSGTIAGCYASGTVSGRMDVGGLVGKNGVRIGNRFDALVFSGSINDCYSNCDVMGVTIVGGLVGFNFVGEITRCYSSGAVLDSEPNQPIDSKEGFFGGFIGYSDFFGIEDCFWDVETSGLTVSAGGIGKTTVQMQTAATFLSWGVCDPLWTIDQGYDYPRFAWENMPGELISGPTYGGGAGTSEDPYLIYTAEEFNMIGLYLCHWDKHFKLMADVDLSALEGEDGRAVFNLIGTDRRDPFTGVFDGNGHTISNLALTGEDNLGMFGRLELGAEVRDLGVVDVNISGSGDFIGALAGDSSGDLTGCYSTGAVSGDDFVGGLVGSNLGSVIHCYSSSTVSGDWRVGGLAGENGRGGRRGSGRGSVAESYSTGTVVGRSAVGGLVGDNFEDAGITSCFWDVETSGLTTSAGGIGKTTAEMQTASTFLEAGWDFVDEISNGTEDIWWILEGQDYPRLAWEAHD